MQKRKRKKVNTASRKKAVSSGALSIESTPQPASKCRVKDRVFHSDERPNQLNATQRQHVAVFCKEKQHGLSGRTDRDVEIDEAGNQSPEAALDQALSPSMETIDETEEATTSPCGCCESFNSHGNCSSICFHA